MLLGMFSVSRLTPKSRAFNANPVESSAVACGVGGSDCPPDNVNGTMSIGFGSGYAYPNNLITPLAGIQYRALQDGNFRVVSSLDNYNLLNISSTAADVDTAIVFASAWAGEGQDRTVSTTPTAIWLMTAVYVMSCRTLS